MLHYCKPSLPTSADFPRPSSCIHTYLFLSHAHHFLSHRTTIPNIALRACSRCHQPRYCPNCKYAVPAPEDNPLDGPRWKLYDKNHHDLSPFRNPSNNQLELLTNDRFMFNRSHGHGNDLRDAELAPRESSEYQTSGCNTPRRSAETLNSSRFSGDVDFNEGHFDSLV